MFGMNKQETNPSAGGFYVFASPGPDGIGHIRFHRTELDAREECGIMVSLSLSPHIREVLREATH